MDEQIFRNDKFKLIAHAQHLILKSFLNLEIMNGKIKPNFSEPLVFIKRHQIDFINPDIHAQRDAFKPPRRTAKCQKFRKTFSTHQSGFIGEFLASGIIKYFFIKYEDTLFSYFT